MRLCAIPNCGREHAARGWCLMHWKRWKRNGNPLTVRNPIGVSPRNRWYDKVRIADNGCWEWQGSHDRRGYGMFHIGKRSANVTTHIVRAHIFGYELFVGPVPPGLELDHLCKNTGCVNPAHVEAVSHAENMFRTRRESCIRGHSDGWIESTTQRYCLACRRERSKDIPGEWGR